MRDTIWYVPYAESVDRIITDCLRTRRKDAVAAFVKKAFGGNEDWEYCKRMGWRIIRVRITQKFWE